MEIADLITRLEALTGPSRELDAEIGRSMLSKELFEEYEEWGWPPVPEYTSSIDAAVGLGDADTLYDAIEDMRQAGWLPAKWKEALCRHICINALKARAQSKEQP